MHRDTIIIFKSHSILMKLYKTGLPVKIPNVTALSNISLATILTNIFTKQKSFLFSNFVNLDKKKKKEFQNGITEGENLQGQKLSKLLTVEETISNSH